MAAYPTVTADPDGGAWCGWVTYQLPGADPSVTFHMDPFVTHERRAHQHSFFQDGRCIVVHYWDGERVRSPVYDHGSVLDDDAVEPWDHPQLVETTIASGRVFDAAFGTRPEVMIDGSDNVWVAWLDYGDSNARPVVRAAHLDGRRWSDPVTAAEPYGDAGRLDWTEGPDDVPLVATGCDTRAPKGEANDDDGSCRVGYVTLPARSLRPRPELRSLRRWVHTRPDIRNPLVGDAIDATGDRTLVFLNYHRHTDLSNCRRLMDGEPELNLRHARDVMGERSAAITDHGRNYDPLAQYRNRRVMRLFHWPGQFVIVPSYEWTGTHAWNGEHLGHLNVHWFEDDESLPYGTPMSADSDVNTSERLRDALDGKKALTIPHHTSNANHYLRPDLFEDEARVPVVEVFQDYRGSCECHEGPGSTTFVEVDDDTSYVQAQLSKGRRLGFVAGGDHQGVALTGVWVDELSRDGIYRALRERRCFATTGTTLDLECWIEDTAMGGVVETTAGEVTLDVEATVPDGVQTLQVVRNNDVIVDDARDSRPDLSESHPIDLERGQNWIYCRLLLDNGEVAWSSPIWVTQRG